MGQQKKVSRINLGSERLHKFIVIGVFTAFVLLMTCIALYTDEAPPVGAPQCLEHEEVFNRLQSLEQKMKSRTGAVKRLGREHDMHLMFIAE